MDIQLRNVKPAKGTKGYIIRVGDTYMFRVYDKDYNFIDYDILHYDLEVEILDTDASLYSSEYGQYLDHAPIEDSK